MLERFEEKQTEYYKLFAQYRDVWYPHVASSPSSSSSGDDDDTSSSTRVPTHWRQVMKFQHPPFSSAVVGWNQVVESERLFRQICLMNHELFVSCASLTDQYYDYDYHHPLKQRHDDDDTTTAAAAGYHPTMDPPSSLYEDVHGIDDEYIVELEEFMSSIVPFWEAMRKERSAIVRRYRPTREGKEKEDTATATTTEEDTASANENNDSNNNNNNNNSWIGWVTNVFKVRRGTSAAAGEQTSHDKQIDVPIVAHEDPECAPSGYHYTKLVGHMYFHYSPLRQFVRQRKEVPQDDRRRVIDDDDDDGRPNKDDDGQDSLVDANSDWESPTSASQSAELERRRRSILEQRATRIRNLVDQCPTPGNLSDKTIRMLVRSYGDMGTLDSSHQAERIYNQYPRHQKNLLWYVLMSYLRVVEDQVYKPPVSQSVGFRGRPPARPRTSRGDAISSVSHVNKTASLATKRICELVSSKHAKHPLEFQSCSQIAFQALACLAPHYDSLHGYFDRVHSLGILKFGPKVWNSMIDITNDDDVQKGQNDDLMKLGLHSKNYKTLHSLILIYGQDEEHLDRALRLVDISFDNYSISDLQETFRRSTFHTLLATLHVRQQQRFAKEESETDEGKHDKNKYTNPELDTAFRLLDKMVMGKIWHPDSETFVSLFGLAGRSGFDSERVWARLELLGSDFHAADEAFLTPSPYVLSPDVAARFTLNAYAKALAKNDRHELLGMLDPVERSWQIVRSLQASSTPLFMPTEETSNIYDPDFAPETRVFDCVLRVCRYNHSPKAVEVALKVLEVAQKKGFLTNTGICSRILKSICNSRDMAQRAKLINHVCQVVMDEDPQLLKKKFRKYAGRQIAYIRNMHPQLFDEHLSELDMKYKFTDEVDDGKNEEGDSDLL
jgi:hypothetical protein